MQKLTRKLYAAEGGRWAVSALLAALLFIAVGLACPRVFFINDDENIMYTVAGYYTAGVPYDHSFINFCLSAVLRGLYALLPAVPWYGVFHMTVLLASVSAVFKAVLGECHARSLPLYLALSVDVALFALLYLFPTTLMQFTTTSAMAGTAACALLLEIRWERDGKRKLLWNLALSVLFLLLCYMHRKNTGYVALCFYFGTWLYQLVKVLSAKETDARQRKRRLRAICGAACAALVLLGAVIGVSAAARSTAQWKAFYEYDNARFKVTDYPHASYEEDPALYESIGWTPALYELAGTYWWFFMDPHITPEAFQAIAETGYYADRTAADQPLLAPAAALFRSTYVAQIGFLAIAACVVALAVLFALSARKREERWEFLYGACILLGAVALILYLCYRQRLPLRAFHTVCLPCVTLLALVCLRVLDLSRAAKRRRVLCVLAAAVLLAASAVGGAVNLRIAAAQANERVEKSRRTLAVEQYAMEHPESFYVYDTTLTFRYMPFTVYTDDTPTNLMFWGGMGWKSPAYYRQLELNGLEELYADALFRDNVYYITWDGYPTDGKLPRVRLLNYMLTTYPSATAEQVDSLGDNVNVYKLGR